MSLSLFLGLTGMAWRPKRPIPKITTTIQGKVFDLDTKNPIPDVKIALSTLAGKAFFSTYTNSSGYYQINVSIPSDYYFLKASKEGYIPKTILRYLQSGKTYTIDFSLKSISPPNHPPKIIRIIPPNGSTFLAGANIKIRVYAYDPNKDPLEYQFLIGGSIKQPWSNSNTYIWQTSASDTAAVDITCQVRDNKGGQSSKTITYHIINPTIKEILQKVADNYAKIYDFKADMSLASTLDGQPFGTPEYCRYYFKAPNKEKTESFTDSSRTTKTEVIIINGSNMYLIDPVKNIKQQVDLLADAGIDATQFNQMDLYYNLTLFLSKHTITKNNSNSELNNMIVALDVIPKTPNNIYDKLGISIDYSKGIIVRYSIYRRNESSQLELDQETKIIASQRMSNNTWLPKKMTKTPNLTSGTFISILTYENIQINTGLTDFDFDPNMQFFSEFDLKPAASLLLRIPEEWQSGSFSKQYSAACGLLQDFVFFCLESPPLGRTAPEAG